jgi:hypothetical protein
MLDLVLSGRSQININSYPQAPDSGTLKAELTMVESDYCKRKAVFYSVPNASSKSVSTHSRMTGELRIRLKLLITNTSSQPIIIDKNAFDIIRRTIAENGKNNAGDIFSNTTYYISPRRYKLEMPSPDERQFAVLKTKETYTVEFNDTASFDIKDTEKLMKGISLRYDLLSWGGRNDYGENLREKWKQFGYLWLDSIRTDSIPIVIKQNNKVAACMQ